MMMREGGRAREGERKAGGRKRGWEAGNQREGRELGQRWGGKGGMGGGGK